MFKTWYFFFILLSYFDVNRYYFNIDMLFWRDCMTVYVPNLLKYTKMTFPNWHLKEMSPDYYSVLLFLYLFISLWFDIKIITCLTCQSSLFRFVFFFFFIYIYLWLMVIFNFLIVLCGLTGKFWYRMLIFPL